MTPMHLTNVPLRESLSQTSSALEQVTMSICRLLSSAEWMQRCALETLKDHPNLRHPIKGLAARVHQNRSTESAIIYKRQTLAR